ncbi:MAG TPA: preprotein translocase subunit SecG [Spirochaetota bacterium]|nr:preprotein translocase subunit SecG [Spirochaetota bacterium]
MGVLTSVVTVSFAIMCVLLILIILLQSDKSAGMGILGGAGQSTFGSSTADIITKVTAVMVAIFMVGSLGLSILESKRISSLREKLFNDKAQDTTVIEKKTEQPSPEKAVDK